MEWIGAESYRMWDFFQGASKCLINSRVVEVCVYAKSYLTVHFKWKDVMGCDLCLSIMVKDNHGLPKGSKCSEAVVLTYGIPVSLFGSL